MKYFVVLFACIYALFSVNLSAQNVAGSVEVGVYSAYEHGYYSGGLPIGEDSNLKTYPTFEASTYNIPTFGGMIEYHLGTVFSLVGILRYGAHSQYLTVPGEKNYYRTADSTLRIYEAEFTCNLDVQAITTSILGKTTISGTNLSILTGADINVVTSNSQEIRFYLHHEEGYPISIDSLPALVPDNIHGQPHRYLDDSHTAMTIYKGEIDNNSNTVLFGITLGLQYDIPLFTVSKEEKRYVLLSPLIIYKMALTNLPKLNYYRASTLDFGLALMVDL